MRTTVAIVALSLLVACPKSGPVNPNGSGQTGTDPTISDVVEERSLPVRQRIDDAADLIDRGGDSALMRARALLQGVVEDAPDNAIAHLNLGIVHQKLGNISEARISYQRAVDSDPEFGDGWLYLGLAQLASDRGDLGVASLRSGVRRAPDHTDLRAALVQALRENGNPDEAIAEAREALKYNSNNLALYNNLGLAYLDKGDLELAKFVFRKGIDGVVGGDKDAWLHTNLGRAYLLDDDLPTARFYLEKAVGFDPNGVPGLVYLAQVYMDDRNYTDAMPLLERAHAGDPTNHGVMVNLGLVYRGVERYDDAVRLYRAALTQDPTNLDPQFNLAILSGDYNKDYDQAIALLREYISRGGARSADAETYIADFEKEKGRATRRRQAEIDAARRDEDRRRRDELLRQEEEQGAPPAQPEPTAPESP